MRDYSAAMRLHFSFLASPVDRIRRSVVSQVAISFGLSYIVIYFLLLEEIISELTFIISLKVALAVSQGGNDDTGGY